MMIKSKSNPNSQSIYFDETPGALYVIVKAIADEKPVVTLRISRDRRGSQRNVCKKERKHFGLSPPPVAPVSPHRTFNFFQFQI